jgi:hypothetical protein
LIRRIQIPSPVASATGGGFEFEEEWGDWTAIGLFVAGACDWEAGLVPVLVSVLFDDPVAIFLKGFPAHMRGIFKIKEFAR